MKLHNAILHIIDINSGITLFSQNELALHEDTIQKYLQKHIVKSMKDPSAILGSFLPQSSFASEFNDFCEGKKSFIEYSQYIVQKINETITGSDDDFSRDIICCDYEIDGSFYFGILECKYNMCYTHHIINDNSAGVSNQLIVHKSILPGPTQKLSSFVIIDKETKQLNFFEQKVFLNGKDIYAYSDKILECTRSLSSKKILQSVNEIVQEVAEENGSNSAIAISRAKRFLSNNAEFSELVIPEELGRDVFHASDLLQEKFNDKITENNLPDKINVSKTFAVRSGKMHKIKTDTGIEISIPVQHYEDNQYVEFLSNPDGTLSLSIKNIGKIINK